MPRLFLSSLSDPFPTAPNAGRTLRPHRRAALVAGAAAGLGLNLAQWHALKAKGPESSGTAKSVILVWLWGGPAHTDLFDPKPNAPLQFRGPFDPIATKLPGIRYTELLPRLAERNDQYALVRSLHTFHNDHGVAGTIGLTGSIDGAVSLGGPANQSTAKPALGSLVSRASAVESALPGYLVVGGRLHQGHKVITGEAAAHLGPRHDPFRVEYKGGNQVQIPALAVDPTLVSGRMEDRDGLRKSLDGLARAADSFAAGPSHPKLDTHRQRALSLLTSATSRRAFDLAQEKQDLRQNYGLNRFGQSCLLARRLVEAGIPFVQVNWSDHVEAEEDAGDGGWDLHYRNFQILQDRLAPCFDQGFAALLDDLRLRGLLSSTLVIAVGEFGRSPKINDKAGRDHWEHCYGAFMAGGGIKPGFVLGSSDATGGHPRDQACTPGDLCATVLQALGVQSEQAATLGIQLPGKPIDLLF